MALQFVSEEEYKNRQGGGTTTLGKTDKFKPVQYTSAQRNAPLRAPANPVLAQDLPEWERRKTPKEQQLSGMIPFYGQARAAEEARERGEGSFLWNMFNTGTPQHERERKATMDWAAQNYEQLPDSLKVLANIGLPGGPQTQLAKAIPQLGKPILGGVAGGTALAFPYGYLGERDLPTGDIAGRTLAGVKAVPFGAALGGAGGAAAHVGAALALRPQPMPRMPEPSMPRPPGLQTPLRDILSRAEQPGPEGYMARPEDIAARQRTPEQVAVEERISPQTAQRARLRFAQGTPDEPMPGPPPPAQKYKNPTP